MKDHIRVSLTILFSLTMMLAVVMYNLKPSVINNNHNNINQSEVLLGDNLPAEDMNKEEISIDKNVENVIANEDDNEIIEDTSEPQVLITYDFEKVGNSYLENSLFIGDSRVALLYEYSDWEGLDFFTAYGMTVWNVEKVELSTIPDTNQISLEEALQRKQYDKIYIMLGINELGRGTPETYVEQYRSVIDHIMELQPDAIIFIHSIMHVTDKKDAEGTYINNTEVDLRNEQIKKLADNKNIFYLDINTVFDDETTCKLKEEYSTDGVHLKASKTDKWKEFLLENGIVKNK